MISNSFPLARQYESLVLLACKRYLVTLPTARAGGFVHGGILGTKGTDSCPRWQNPLNGYSFFLSLFLVSYPRFTRAVASTQEETFIRVVGQLQQIVRRTIRRNTSQKRSASNPVPYAGVDNALSAVRIPAVQVIDVGLRPRCQRASPSVHGSPE